jgi:peptidoglycan/LPS O-acetylase OafA/YrhL
LSVSSEWFAFVGSGGRPMDAAAPDGNPASLVSQAVYDSLRPGYGLLHGNMNCAMRFRFDIQGLRAVAVLSILVFHADPAWLPGGFVGVDIFFVISGFVITSIVMRDIERNTFSLADFYRKRVARIFPALYAMLAASLVAGCFLLIPSDFEELAKTTLATIFYVSNVVFMQLSGYFDGAAEMKPLLHTWSLAVEEQFYLVYPLALLLVARFGRRWLPLAFAAGIIGSLALCVWLLRGHASAAFYLSPPRAFELLIGAAAAALPQARVASHSLREGLAWLGAGLIAASIALYSADMAFPGLAALPPTIGTGLIILAGRDEATRVGRLLSNRAFVYVGALSYSLYLWHWPLIVYTRHLTDAPLLAWQAAALIALSLVAAAASYRFVEQPFQRGGRLADLPFLRVGAGAMAIGGVVAALVIVSGGLPQRYRPDALAAFAAAEEFSPFRAACHEEGGRSRSFAKLCRIGSRDAEPDTIVWGDSHGVEIAAAVSQSPAFAGRSLLESTMSACPPSLGYDPARRPLCRKQNDETLRGVLASPTIGTVILAAYFNVYRNDKAEEMRSGYRALVEQLTAAGKRVVLVSPIPVYEFDPPAMIGEAIEDGTDPADLGLPTEEYLAENRQAIDLLRDLSGRDGVDIVWVDRALCDEVRCRLSDPALGALYFNATHLDMTGAGIVARQIAAAL